MNITDSADLPPSWAVTTLGDLKPARGEGVNPGKQPDASFELYSVTNFPVGKPQMLKGREIGSNKQSVEPGTVLLCGINPRINRVWIVSKSTGVPQIASTEWIPFPPLPGILPEYACYFLQQNKIRDYLARRASGVGGSLMRVKAFTCTDVPFPLAPQREQRQIVEEIEKQFTRLEAGVAALKRVQANLRRYRAAVLKAAVEGRLVPTEAELARREGRSYEPASELLVTQPLLAVSKKAQVAQPLLAVSKKAQAGVPVPLKPKSKEPVAPDTTDLPKLPDGWAWACIDQLIVEPPCNGISVKGNDSPPGIAALKLNAMSDHGFDYSIVRYLPLEEAVADDLWIREGDFFVSRGNGSLKLVGRGTSAQNPPSKIIFPDTMIRLRFATELRLTNWIPAIWPSSFFRRQVEHRVKTTAGIYKISQPQVRSIAVPLPPLAEQRRIVADVERRLSVIDELEMQVEANLKRAERLRQAILKRAFEGKLVPQDPNDEPASMLLERIRNAKAAGGTATPGCAPTASDSVGRGRRKNPRTQPGAQPGVAVSHRNKPMSFYRRNLPHWHPEGKAIFITWRLFGSLPKGVAPGRSHWARKSDTATPGCVPDSTAKSGCATEGSTRKTAGWEFRKMDAELDRGATGPLWLREPIIAGYVEDALFRGEELKQYELDTYVVMPNHVHVLLWPWISMDRITNGIKGVSARDANVALRRTEQHFWEDESFDHWVRNEAELARIRAYIERNPVTAGLAERPEDWPWSSAANKVTQPLLAVPKKAQAGVPVPPEKH